MVERRCERGQAGAEILSAKLAAAAADDEHFSILIIAPPAEANAKRAEQAIRVASEIAFSHTRRCR